MIVGFRAARLPRSGRASETSRPIWPQRLAGERPKSTVQWAELINRVARHGDRDAFKCLFEHFAPRVKGFLVKTGTDPESAEDIAQSTMVAVWRKAAQFDPSTLGAAPWIFTIARNLRIDAVRRSACLARTIRPNEPNTEVELAESPEAIFGRQQDASRVRSALANLSDEQSMVIRLSFIEERSHADIASALGIPLGTVKSRIRLAMNRLRELLDEPK